MSTKAGMTYINNAAYTRAWMAGTATVGAPDDYDPYALLRVGAFGDQVLLFCGWDEEKGEKGGGGLRHSDGW